MKQMKKENTNFSKFAEKQFKRALWALSWREAGPEVSHAAPVRRPARQGVRALRARPCHRGAKADGVSKPREPPLLNRHPEARSHLSRPLGAQAEAASPLAHRGRRVPRCPLAQSGSSGHRAPLPTQERPRQGTARVRLAGRKVGPHHRLADLMTALSH